jgi:hypothetical protein
MENIRLTGQGLRPEKAASLGVDAENGIAIFYNVVPV